MDETPLNLLNKRNKAMHSLESIEAGRKFMPRESDVFVTTYPKCGTCYTLFYVANFPVPRNA